MEKKFYTITIKKGTGYTDFYDVENVDIQFNGLDSAINWIKQHPNISGREYPKNNWWWFSVSEFDPNKQETLNMTKTNRIIMWFANLLSYRYGRDWMVGKTPPNGTQILRPEKTFFYDWDGNEIYGEPIRGYHKKLWK